MLTHHLKTKIALTFVLTTLLILTGVFFSVQTPVAQASSCGTVYLYTANCRVSCSYNSSSDQTFCNVSHYEEWTAPPAKRHKYLTAQLFPGYWEPNCSTFCQ